ncbi:uncharacterized protein LOC122380777 [Amphibalanus amphitrite]|uniref:uncharacterized protein LOC122380777 n=1 Tax=Amphibalanus amphitrite TaxID=1232801 RepID=UPI001C91D479|nr:uncharacterized protein LOC122380777 [Amphibalanus amphitrite]
MIQLLLLTALSAAAGAQSLTECLSRRPLQDVSGTSLPPLSVRQVSAPQSCVQLLCTDDPLVVHTDGEITYASVNIDDTSAQGSLCMDEVRGSRDAYVRSNLPVTFYRAGDVHLVIHDSTCPATRLEKQRLLLLTALKGQSVQPLEAFILCDSDLQVTKPAMHVQMSSQEGTVTHVTMYSGPQARAASSGFVPQYARLEIANDFVVSVLSSCVGDPTKMELINKLGATWLGEMDSCLRLLCHSGMEELALGYYNYLLYDNDKMEGEACFKALQTNQIGSTVDTPLTQVRVVSAEGDSCTGTKIMVLNPTYSGTSKKLQRFLYYQAYKIHSFDCPELAETCLQQKLAQLGYTGPRIPTKSEFPYQCANLLCDSRVGLSPTAFSKTAFHVTVENDKMRPLNNVCFKSLSRSKAGRRSDSQTVRADVPSLGVSVLFSLL